MSQLVDAACCHADDIRSILQLGDNYQVDGSTLRAMVECAVKAEKSLEKAICVTVEATDACIKERDVIHALRVQLEGYLGDN